MALHHNPRIVTEGLIMLLDSLDINSYPGSGSQWKDLSGKGNDTTFSYGDYSNGVFISVEVPDYASRLEFYTPNSTSIFDAFSTTTGGWQIEEVILINDITYPESPAGTVVSGSAYSSGAIGFDWNHGNSMGLNSIQMGAGNNSGGEVGYDVRTSISVPDNLQTFGTWVHRSFYWNRSNNTMGVYINGIHCGSIDISILAGLPIYDGQGISWGQLYGWRHDGARAGIKIYNRVLTAEEVQTNYEVHKNRFNL